MGPIPGRMIKTAALAALACAGDAMAQPFTAADSGWAPLFNGKDYAGLYSRMYNGPVKNHPNVDAIFTVRNAGTDSAEMYVLKGGATLGTQRTSYSHYRVRIQYRFETVGGLNAGLLYHVDETYPRMGGDGTAEKGNWPRSIECQMRQGEGGDAFSIQQVTFDTRVTSGHWDPAGKAIKVCQYGCDGRNFTAFPELDRATAWNDMEAVIRGSDSAAHRLNGQDVFRLWNIRLTDNTGKDLSPWPSGAIGLEAEGAIVHYRRWEVMELPATGPSFLNRLFLDAPGAGEKLAPKSTYAIKWRTIGGFKKVNLEYDAGAGWKPLADSVENTGSHAWTVPSDATQSLRVRISGPAYVRADTSGVNAIAAGSGIRHWAAGRYFAFGGKRLSLESASPGVRLLIEDVSGRRVRELALGMGPGDVSWDGRDAAGRVVEPGFYFARLPGSPARLRLAVF